jgi:hypothetical protein
MSMVICLCQRCEHVWYSRTDERPCVCPSCKTAYWDKPRKGEIKKDSPARIIK